MIWLILTRIFTLLPKIIAALVYLITFGYSLYIMNYGFASFVELGLLYHPIEAMTYAYNYMEWAMDNRRKLEGWMIMIIVISALLPVVVARVATNLYYLTIFLATSSIKGLTPKQILMGSKSMRSSRPGLLSPKKPVDKPAAQTTTKNPLAGVKFLRVKSESMQQLKNETMQDSALQSSKKTIARIDKGETPNQNKAD